MRGAPDYRSHSPYHPLVLFQSPSSLLPRAPINPPPPPPPDLFDDGLCCPGRRSQVLPAHVFIPSIRPACLNAHTPPTDIPRKPIHTLIRCRRYVHPHTISFLSVICPPDCVQGRAIKFDFQLQQRQLVSSLMIDLNVLYNSDQEGLNLEEGMSHHRNSMRPLHCVNLTLECILFDSKGRLWTEFDCRHGLETQAGSNNT